MSCLPAGQEDFRSSSRNISYLRRLRTDCIRFQFPVDRQVLADQIREGVQCEHGRARTPMGWGSREEIGSCPQMPQMTRVSRGSISLEL
jgi:hypothetical protein